MSGFAIFSQLKRLGSRLLTLLMLKVAIFINPLYQAARLWRFLSK